MPLKPRKPAPGSRYQPPGYQGQAGRRGLPAHNTTGRRPPTGHTQMKPIRRPLPPELLKRIDTDPLFAVMTGDQQWINPFTGEPVSASQGRAETARAHLVDNTTWRDKEPLPRMQLEVIRWRIDLMRLLPVEPRLRIFGRDGRWLNPFNGELVSDIVREEGKITAHTITAMARVLCSCPEAMSGRLLDSQTLSAKIQQLGIGSGTSGPIRSESSSSATGLSADMVKARNVQQHMLADLPTVEGYEFGVHFTPHSGVSGDFYEVIKLKSGRLMFVIGDVSGHGMQAALVVATALKTLRFLARNTSNMSTLLVQFNDEIRPDLLPGQFITIFAAELDPVTGSLSCIRAGHHAAVMVSAEADVVVRKVGRQGMAIGLAAGPIFAGSMHAEVVHLQPGDVLMQYTDGLTEGMNAEQVEYGETRLYASMFTHIEQTTQEMVDLMAKDLLAHVGGQLDDDLTIFAISMLPKPEDMASSGEWDQMDPPKG